jgi:hypothetical protein
VHARQNSTRGDCNPNCNPTADNGPIQDGSSVPAMNSTTAEMSTAKVTVRARDKAGNVATAKRTIKLVK